MKYQQFSFRLADEILRQRKEWHEFEAILKRITADDICEAHKGICKSRKTPPAGGQTAVNHLFRNQLAGVGWASEPRLFGSTQEKLRQWKMDFIKNRVGIEISFNHAEAIPWTFTRLNIAGESERIQVASKIDIGIVVFASQSFKTWAKIDSAAGTYELAIAWLREMKPILPIPLLVIGLEASGWKPTSLFRGTRAGLRSSL